MEIKAIETHYNGYKFRSRLEARWAVFFDEAEIEYQYEPEEFDINGTWYLPDFYLPWYKCYVEIIEIREDNKKSRETKDVKEFNQNIDEYEDNELHIISLRTFYNKYTLEYNNLIKKIPFNLVAKLKGYKIKTLLEGREIDDSFNNDLEV